MVSLSEAYAAGWKAKSKKNEKRKDRGFCRPKSNSPREGAGTERAPTTDVDPRKANSDCASCGKVGRWKGDPICESVVKGRPGLAHTLKC